MIKQKLELIKKGNLTAEQNIKEFLRVISQRNKELNAVLHVNDNAVHEAKNVDEKIKNGSAGKLAGLGVIIKSNINVKGLITNCASRTLENYKATFNATVIEKLLAEDAIILGMANMDEFACGASGELSAFGATKNPAALDRIPGGSSSGSAASMAAGFCDFALGSDTGGSIRNPSSHCGVVGFKPTYGTVSRYGLIDLSMSFDQIGPICNCVDDVEIIYNIIKGKDENDSSSRKMIASNQLRKTDKVKIAMPKVSASDKIWELVYNKTMQVCGKNKWDYELGTKIKHIDLGIQTYYPIVYVEFFSGTRRFDGRKYGFKIEDVCGKEVLRRILGGKEISKAEFAGKYYRRALKARKIIEKEFEDLFKKFDIVVMPTVPRLPHKIGETLSLEDYYNYDSLTVLANLCEIPAISIPVGKVNGIPVGLQIMTSKGNDAFLLKIAREFE